MGWCSGTDAFDAIVGAILVHPKLSKKDKVALIVIQIKALEDMDWDCQYDSDHIDHPLVNQAFKQIHEDWDEEYE